jgi:hypothetical protein
MPASHDNVRLPSNHAAELGWTWSAESENRPQQAQFSPDLQPHSPTMWQKAGEKSTTAVDLRPAIPSPTKLLHTGQHRRRVPRVLPALAVVALASAFSHHLQGD